MKVIGELVLHICWFCVVVLIDVASFLCGVFAGWLILHLITMTWPISLSVKPGEYWSGSISNVREKSQIPKPVKNSDGCEFYLPFGSNLLEVIKVWLCFLHIEVCWPISVSFFRSPLKPRGLINWNTICLKFKDKICLSLFVSFLTVASSVQPFFLKPLFLGPWNSLFVLRNGKLTFLSSHDN